MAFVGTQLKCKVCDKTVYIMDQVSANGVAYHKSCFKCNHCKGTLKLSNFSSKEGVLYCKPHFELLFKETGSYNKSFQSPVKAAVTTGEKVTPALVAVEGRTYHKSCFKCFHGGCSITLSNYAALEGILYCKPHFAQLFKEKGSYNHLIKCASVKRPAAPPPPEA